MDCFSENPRAAVHERWSIVLTECPFTRDRPIYDDFDDDLQRVYLSGTYAEVFGATELVLLRWRFFSQLYMTGVGMRHIASYEVHAAWVWMRKLSDRLDQLHTNRKRAPKEKMEVLQHVWLN
jgi:hypothetical protein